MTSKIVVNNIGSDTGINTVTFDSNVERGTSNLHSVGVEVAGINVLGADTPIGTGSTIYDDGGARFSGIVTATSFSGSFDASNLTGTVADARISTLTASKLSGTLPAISGANLTNLPASGKATNLVVNGAMMVAQRGTSSTSSGYHTVDRFKYTYSGTDNAPTQSQSDVASGTTPYTLGFRKAYKITNANQTSVGVSDRIRLEVNLEAQDIANSGWNYTSASSNITLSFWCKSSVAQNFYGNIRTPDGSSQQYSFETGSLTADTWTKITKTIPGNSNLTFDNNAELGWNMDITMFMGTDNTTSGNTMNQWYTYDSSNQIPDNTSTWYTTNSATWEITGMQLEVGDTATDFAHERYADTILKCYRYYYAHKGMLWGITSASDHLDLNLTFPVPMRATPSRTQVDTSLLFKNRLDQENSTSASTYSYSGAVSPTGDFWVARPGSGDSWGVSYTSSDTHAVYWHPHEGTTSYAWSAEL